MFSYLHYHHIFLLTSFRESPSKHFYPSSLCSQILTPPYKVHITLSLKHRAAHTICKSRITNMVLQPFHRLISTSISISPAHISAACALPRCWSPQPMAFLPKTNIFTVFVFVFFILSSKNIFCSSVQTPILFIAFWKRYFTLSWNLP